MNLAYQLPLLRRAEIMIYIAIAIAQTIDSLRIAIVVSGDKVT